MTRTILLNALATRLGGGATVWAALLSGGRAFGEGLSIAAVTGDRQVYSLLKRANPDLELHHVKPRGGISGFAGEAKLIDGLLGTDPSRIVVTQNRMTRGHDGPQVVLQVNLSRFQEGTGARGWKQRPAELVRDATTKAALAKADANIFESNYLLDAAQARYPDLTINNPSVALVGIEASWAVDPEAEVNPLTARNKRLLAVTSPNPHKDNDVLIKTLAELERAEPGAWTLGLAGGRNPQLWDPQMALAESLGVRGSIELLGFVDRDQLVVELDNSAALISPSRVESFAMVPLEAMARGLPVLVTNEASMPESVGDAGILLPAGRADAFASAALALVGDESAWLERSQAGRRWAAAMSWDRFGHDVMKTIRQIAE